MPPVALFGVWKDLGGTRMVFNRNTESYFESENMNSRCSVLIDGSVLREVLGLDILREVGLGGDKVTVDEGGALVGEVKEYRDLVS